MSYLQLLPFFWDKLGLVVVREVVTINEWPFLWGASRLGAPVLKELRVRNGSLYLRARIRSLCG
jgi:hypothetical protein